MRRAVLLVLAVSLPGGCRSLRRDVFAVEYRPGATPTTVVAKYDSTFSLTAPEPNIHIAYANTDVPKGTIVGYRREPDGSVVAFAGEKVTPIEDCHSVWRFTPKPVTGWDRFAVGTRDRCEATCDRVKHFLLSPLIEINGTITGEWP